MRQFQETEPFGLIHAKKKECLIVMKVRFSRTTIKYKMTKFNGHMIYRRENRNA